MKNAIPFILLFVALLVRMIFPQHALVFVGIILVCILMIVVLKFFGNSKNLSTLIALVLVLLVVLVSSIGIEWLSSQ